MRHITHRGAPSPTAALFIFWRAQGLVLMGFYVPDDVPRQEIVVSLRGTSQCSSDSTRTIAPDVLSARQSQTLPLWIKTRRTEN